MRRFEKVMLIFYFAALIGHCMDVPLSTTVWFVAMIVLVVFYYFTGFALFNRLTIREVFRGGMSHVSGKSITTGISGGVTAAHAYISIFVLLNFLPGGAFLAMTVILLAIITSILLFKSKDALLRFSTLSRLAIPVAITVVLAFTSTEDRLKITVRDPMHRDLLYMVIEYPEDVTAKWRLENFIEMKTKGEGN